MKELKCPRIRCNLKVRNPRCIACKRTNKDFQVVRVHGASFRPAIFSVGHALVCFFFFFFFVRRLQQKKHTKMAPPPKKARKDSAGSALSFLYSAAVDSTDIGTVALPVEWFPAAAAAAASGATTPEAAGMVRCPVCSGICSGSSRSDGGMRVGDSGCADASELFGDSSDDGNAIVDDGGVASVDTIKEAYQRPSAGSNQGSDGSGRSVADLVVLCTDAIPGLRLVKSFLTETEQACLMAQVDSEYLAADGGGGRAVGSSARAAAVGGSARAAAVGGSVGVAAGSENGRLASSMEEAEEREEASSQNVNQAMVFGEDNFPPWAHRLVGSVALLPELFARATANHPSRFRHATSANAKDGVEMLCNRQPLFDQMIINEYWPGEGIGEHVDLLSFEDGILSVSMGSTCIMRFKHRLVTAAPSSHLASQSKDVAKDNGEADCTAKGVQQGVAKGGGEEQQAATTKLVPNLEEVRPTILLVHLLRFF